MRHHLDRRRPRATRRQRGIRPAPGRGLVNNGRVKAGSRAASGVPVEQMCEWYLAGDSNLMIGQRVGLHQGTVRRVLIEAGVAMRSRREQVALNDARVGVRAPTVEELIAGYINEGLTTAELAARYGVSESRVHARLRRRGVQLRPGGIRPERVDAERAERRPVELVEEIIALYQSGLAQSAVAAQVGVHRVVVRDVLRRAGVEQRPVQRKLPPVTEWADRYVDGGETGGEIGASYGVAPGSVLRALAVAGVERRPAKVRMPALDDDAVVACYIDEGLSLQATAARLGVSLPRVRAAVGRLGILRTKFDPSTVDRARFSRRHAGGATLAELAAEFQLSSHAVSVAVRSFGLPSQLAVRHGPLTITDRRLELLIAAGHSDADIAVQHGVAVWAVVRRRRQSGLRRPPHRVRPPISRDSLMRQLAAGTTRADIATAHHVGMATVTLWCAHYDITVVTPRPSASVDVEFDPKQLRDLYVGEQWSARQIGDHLGIDASLVVFALHSHRIPVRHGGDGTQDDAVVLLDALYADSQVVAVLQRHKVPLQRRGGTLTHRFPHPGALSTGLVEELYGTVGLSASHIALLTGHSPSNVYDVLRRHGTPARAGGRSPWYTRTFL